MTAIQNASKTSALLYGAKVASRQELDPPTSWNLNPGNTRDFESTGGDSAYYYLFHNANTLSTPNPAFWSGRIRNEDQVNVVPENCQVIISHTSITPLDLNRFKALFPENEKVQAVTLEELIENSKGKFHDGSSARASGEPPPHPARSALTECQLATVSVVIDAFCLITGAVGIRGKISPSWMGKVAEALELNDFEVLIKKFNTPNITSAQQAYLIWEIFSLIKNGGNLEAVYKAIVGGLSWWDMILYGVLGIAELTAAFLTDGLALAASIGAELATVSFFVTDLVRVTDECGVSKKQPSAQAQWVVVLPQSDDNIHDIVPSVWGAGNDGKDRWGTWNNAPLVTCKVEGSIVTLTTTAPASAQDEYVAVILRYKISGGRPRVYAGMALTQK